MNSPKIVQMRVGYTHVALILNGSQSILVDTGKKGIIPILNKKLKQFNLTFSDIQLIILTHVHFDHTGDLNELAALTKAKVVVHSLEKEALEKGFMPIPKGTNPFSRIIYTIGWKLFPRYASPKPFNADIVVEEDMSLLPWGVNAKVIHTPGHTKGSQSVLIGNRLISGDCFFNITPGCVFPPFADNPKQLLRSWAKLFALGVKEIYPAHGSRFNVDRAFDSHEKWMKKLY